ncbi:hypothetical protein [Actinocrispum wychmicini]|uniref:ABC-2 type transport system permease protein n=1 Tax=Actinocrispum wychmicini TaxID=1213861 RepID=A0A4R2JMB2_9PSEU|nr:hypothetical protein [Actinocrispum wychmicini]TCO58228.1 ABC-2 type transport system permease protein [Actinocrispum wychmicini]
MTAFIRFEVIRTLRNVRYLAFLVVVPVLLYLMWGRTGGPGAMVAMAVYAACGGALLGGGSTIAEDRATGWLRQLRITPLADRAWLGGKIVQGTLMAIPGALVVCVVAASTGHVSLSVGQWAGLGVLILVGCLPFALIGVFGGMLFKGKTATVALMLLFIALMLVGGVITGGQQIVSWGNVVPSYDLMAAGIQIVHGTPIGGGYVVNLGGWALLGGAAVLLRWRRA